MVQARSSLEDIGLPGPENKVRFLLEISVQPFPEERYQTLAGNRFPNLLRISFCHRSVSMRVLTTL